MNPETGREFAYGCDKCGRMSCEDPNCGYEGSRSWRRAFGGGKDGDIDDSDDEKPMGRPVGCMCNFSRCECSDSPKRQKVSKAPGCDVCNFSRCKCVEFGHKSSMNIDTGRNEQDDGPRHRRGTPYDNGKPRMGRIVPSKPRAPPAEEVNPEKKYDDVLMEMAELNKQKGEVDVSLGKKIELEHEIVKKERELKALLDDPRINEIYDALITSFSKFSLLAPKETSLRLKLIKLTDSELESLKEVMKVRAAAYVHHLICM